MSEILELVSSHQNLSLFTDGGNTLINSARGDLNGSQEGKRVNILPLLVLLIIQCSLLHPAFSHSRLARLLRIGLMPINFVWCFISPFQTSSIPPEPHKSLTGFSGSAFYIYMAVKSLEWGFSPESYYTRPLKSVDGVKRWQKPKQDDGSYKRIQEEEPPDIFKLVTWTLLQLTSFRGLQFTWGPAIAASTESTLSLLWRMFRLNIPLTSTLAFIVMTRDSPQGTPSSALISLGVPNFPGLTVLSEAVYTTCFGIWVACSLDVRYTLLTLVATLLHKLSILIGLPQHMLELFDPIYFPPIFNSPQFASSIAQFWTRWHTVLQRVFLVAGGKPMLWITEKMGASSKTQRLAGLFGTFAASALLHEYLASVWRQDSSHVISRSFLGSSFYFMIQPLAILIEPYLIPLIPKKLGGGMLWVWIFSIVTAHPFQKQYLKESAIVSIFTPVSQWSWVYILSPLKD